MQPGDRVKLTARGQRAKTSKYGRKSRINWIGRRGVLVRYNAYSVWVMWDGTSTIDQWPRAAVEPVEAED